VGGGQQIHHLSGGVGRLVISWRVWRRWRYSSGVDLAAGQPLGQDVLGAGPWLLAGLSLLVGRAGVP